MDELNSLPYLDCVIRETLRLYPVLTATIRVAVKDDIVPLAQPVRDANGVIIAENLEVKKGQLVSFGVLPLNVSKDIWGDDASEFRLVPHHAIHLDRLTQTLICADRRGGSKYRKRPCRFQASGGICSPS